MKLYGYFRSSASFRVRIGLNLKNIAYDFEPIHLLRDGGEQYSDQFAALNPQRLVPVLIDGEHLLTQSLAILEYLDESHPTPSFLPADVPGRARVRALAQIIACDIHPLDNLRVLKYLTKELEVGEEDRAVWYRHWIALGLGAMEDMMAGHDMTGEFCHGDSPTVADICLVPQIFNARRFDTELDGYPTVMRIFDTCMALDAFDRAQPKNQPDAQ